MCNDRSAVLISLAHARADGVREVGVDRCIAPLVQALNDVGLQTRASCCGHSFQPGSIILEDGRELRICTFDQGRAFDKLFPDIHGNQIET